MGGGSYRGDVSSRSSSSSASQRTFQRRVAKQKTERKCHAKLVPLNSIRECRDSEEHPNTTPIAVGMDVTRSRGKDVGIMYKKIPMFFGQICMHNYVPDPTISFSAIGDATDGDIAPVQIGQFEADNRLDDVLGYIWQEEGGGGTGQESYQLLAYYYARKTMLDSLEKRKQKGYMFIQGDEGFYPEVDKDEVKKVFGDTLQQNIPSEKIFKELQKKYHTFFILVEKAWETRKKDIDEEIKQRVTKAGGLIEGVDVRFSLIWGNRNDLDLHVVTPDGYHIYYSDKKSPCGGYLDVDMNVQGETTKPVENIRWKKGKAPKGQYKVFVQNYSFHESNQKATPFKVEIEINGEIQHFEGKTAANKSGSASDIKVGTFTFDPKKRPNEIADDERYANYDLGVIENQWASVIPRENILKITDPNAMVDVQLGALAIVSGSRTLDTYMKDMEEKGQTEERMKDVRSALTDLAEIVTAPKVSVKKKTAKKTKSRKSRTTRL